MTEQLENKYRPIGFDEYIGGETIKKSLLSILPSKRLYLLYGQRGCGKTTIARLIGSELKINERDIKEIDAADKTGIDDARKLKESVGYAPLAGKHKLYIIDECHRLTGNAFDSLLKTFEEPPPHVYFVLCTTELAKVPQTIKSRAASYEMKPLNKKESFDLLNWVCEEEDIKIDETVFDVLFEQCQGNPREMIIALSMIRELKDQREMIELIQSTAGSASTIDLCRALLKKEKWKVIAGIISEITDEPESVRYAVLGYMSSVILKGENKQAAMVISCFSESFMYSKKAGLILACYEAVL